jgi:hypothetical protein
MNKFDVQDSYTEDDFYNEEEGGDTIEDSEDLKVISHYYYF